MKRKLTQPQVSRKLRSTLPRRRRPEISPIIFSGTGNEVSGTYSLVKSSESFRRIVTRLYSKKREKEVSELSCVDSSSVLTSAEKNETSTAEFTGKITKLEPEDERESRIPAVDEGESRIAVTDERESRKPAVAAVSDSSCVESCSNKQNELSTAEFAPKLDIPVPGCSDLVCSEMLLCDEDESDYSSAFSDLGSDVFGQSSSENYTPSIWLDSGSEFSEKSFEDLSPSPTFSLFIQFSHQFCPSAFSRGSKSVSEIENEYRGVGMEDEEDELSYTMLRSRERREVYTHDYAEEYCSETDYGHLVIQQRLQMVHWIVEESTSKELQKETLFLGVSLLDRFLSKGFFKNKRNLQVAGIACLALATRIEENQPFNSVRKRTICVGSDTYSRCEVVAMEWLVQEVLNFQCFMPTIYNFLWFYLKAVKANEDVERTAKYLAVLALLGHEQLCFWPSTVAAGLVILASLSANEVASCNSVVETHVRTKEDDLSGCLKSLEWLVKYAC